MESALDDAVSKRIELFRERLFRYKSDRKFDYKELSSKTGVHPNTIWNFINNRSAGITLSIALKLSIGLGVEL